MTHFFNNSWYLTINIHLYIIYNIYNTYTVASAQVDKTMRSRLFQRRRRQLVLVYVFSYSICTQYIANYTPLH